MSVLDTRFGSTFTILTYEFPTKESLGSGDFIGRDDWSVFDAKSHISDKISDKGAAITAQSYGAEVLAREVGIPTTITGYEAPNILEVKLAEFGVPREEVSPRLTCYVVDAEFIFRNFINEKSSVLRKYSNGELTLEMLSWDEFPPVNTWLDKPVFNITHKFLPGDPYYDLSGDWAEFKDFTGMTMDDWRIYWGHQQRFNIKLQDYLSSVGMKLPDGKNECVIGPRVDGRREIYLSDVLFNQDNNRVLVLIDDEWVPWSKQFLRDYKMYVQFYDWYEPFMTKKLVEKAPFSEWTDDPGTPRQVLDFASDFYKSFTERFLDPLKEEFFDDSDVFPDAPLMREVYEAKKPIQDEINEAKEQVAGDLAELNQRIKN